MKPGTIHFHVGASAKEMAAGTVIHQTPTIAARREKRAAAQAPGIMPAAQNTTRMALRTPTTKREAPKCRA